MNGSYILIPKAKEVMDKRHPTAENAHPWAKQIQFIVTARIRISDSDTKFRVQSSTEFMLCQQ